MCSLDRGTRSGAESDNMSSDLCGTRTDGNLFSRPSRDLRSLPRLGGGAWGFAASTGRAAAGHQPDRSQGIASEGTNPTRFERPLRLRPDANPGTATSIRRGERRRPRGRDRRPGHRLARRDRTRGPIGSIAETGRPNGSPHRACLVRARRRHARLPCPPGTRRAQLGTSPAERAAPPSCPHRDTARRAGRKAPPPAFAAASSNSRLTPHDLTPPRWPGQPHWSPTRPPTTSRSCSLSNLSRHARALSSKERPGPRRVA